MSSKLRLTRVDPAAFGPVNGPAADAALHRDLQRLIRRHLPPVTASLLAEPGGVAADGRIEWYTDLAGEPRRLPDLPPPAQDEARALLAQRMAALEALAVRLEAAPGADGGLAAQLRRVTSFPGEGAVYVVDGQPVLTFWGQRPQAQPAPPPSPPVPLAPADVVAPATAPTAAPAAATGRPRLWWLLALAAAAAGAVILGLLFVDFTQRFGGRGEEMAAARSAVAAAEAEGAALEQRLEALRADLQQALDECRLRQEEAARLAEEAEAARKTAEEEAARKAAEEEARKAAEEEAARKAAEEEAARKAAQADAARKAAQDGARAEAVPCVVGDDALDLYFLQDLTSSLRDDLPNMARFMTQLAQRIGRGDFGTNVKVGLGSFTDKPAPPFGMPSHYVFRPHLPLGDASRLPGGLRGLRVLEAGDGPEAQYEALVELAANAKAVGFRKDARKFVVVLTDAPPHVAGDWAGIPFFAVRRADDGVGDGDPLDEDFPSATQVSQALARADLTPVFLVAGRALPVYRNLVAGAGRGAALPLSADSSDVMSALLEGMKKACAP
jgi:hypothetical protein